MKFFEIWQNFKNQPQKYGGILKFKEAKSEKLTNLGQIRLNFADFCVFFLKNYCIFCETIVEYRRNHFILKD